MTERYVELHARSAFSFLEGASLPEAMAQQAANLELSALAILDRSGGEGAARFKWRGDAVHTASRRGFWCLSTCGGLVETNHEMSKQGNRS